MVAIKAVHAGEGRRGGNMERIVEVSTAAEARRIGKEAGLEGEALDFAVALGGPRRHRMRVEAAMDALLKASGGNPQVAYALASLDAMGVGGPHDLGGESGRAVRLPALRHLGTGRKQALDGDAWSAAIEEAAASIVGGTGLPGEIGFEADDAGVVSLYLEDGSSLPLPEIPADWRRTLAKRVIARAAGWCVPKHQLPLPTRGSLAAWGAVLNRACEEAEEEAMCSLPPSVW